MKKKIGLYLTAIIAIVAIAKATVITYNQVLFSSTALAYNATATLDLQANSLGTVSAQAVYSTATIAVATFQDGTQSTGTFTVNNYLALSGALASNSITVAALGNLQGAAVIVPGYYLVNGIDWATLDTVTGTAVSLMNALQTVPWITASQSNGVITLNSISSGTYYNTKTLVSTNGNIVVANPTFIGGQDNAVIAINGTQLKQGIDWTAATSNNVTATNIAAAINASTNLNTLVTAIGSSAIVYTTSTINGAKYNYNLLSSNPTALTASGAKMINGTDSNFTLGSNVFTSTGGPSLTLALPVLYTGSPAIGGLTTGTTYYSVPTTGNSFMLAKYSTSAVAGNIDLVSITSTNTQVTADTYLLSPLTITGKPGLSWSVSNDNLNWSTLNVSSVTISTTAAGSTTIWPFGYLGERYLRLNATAPTAGGLNVSVQVLGTP